MHSWRELPGATLRTAHVCDKIADKFESFLLLRLITSTKALLDCIAVQNLGFSTFN